MTQIEPIDATGLFLYPLLSGSIKRDQWHEIHSLINKLRITRLTLTNFPTSLIGVTKYNTKYKLWGTLEHQSNPNEKKSNF